VCKKLRALTKTATVWFLGEETNQPTRRTRHECTDELRIGLQELLPKARMEHDADLLKEGVRVLSQALMEMEVETARRRLSSRAQPRRTGQRNGYRQRGSDTRVGTVELKMPRVRDGGYFPSPLEPRRKAERVLSVVVQETYVHGASTRNFTYKSAQNREPASGLEPLTCSLRVRQNAI
jgi:hypothetical protein